MGSGEVTKDDVDHLTNPDALEDDEMMIPVDMRGIDGDFQDVDELVTKLGIKGTAEAFVKAREYFVANKDGEKDDERATNMTAKEWKELLMGDGEDLEEELFEGEEEEFDDEEEDEGDEEPAAK